MSSSDAKGSVMIRNELVLIWVSGEESVWLASLMVSVRGYRYGSVSGITVAGGDSAAGADPRGQAGGEKKPALTASPIGVISLHRESAVVPVIRSSWPSIAAMARGPIKTERSRLMWSNGMSDLHVG